MDLRAGRSNESRVRNFRRCGPPLQRVRTLRFCRYRRIVELELWFEIRSQFPATLTVHALGAKYLMDLESVGLEHRDHRADFVQFAVGEHVTFDERTADPGRSAQSQRDLDLP